MPDLRPLTFAVSTSSRWASLLWAWPLLLSLLLVLDVLTWARWNEAQEREQQRLTLISDALSAEAQLRALLDDELVHLHRLGAELRGRKPSHAHLAAQGEVNAGLRRLWLSVTWLDAQKRVLAEVPQVPDKLNLRQEPGLSMHLSVPLGGDGADGSLVARYAPALLLKRGMPWWLARRYDVQLLDSADQVIASSTDGPTRVGGDPAASYRIAFAPNATFHEAALELTLRERDSSNLKPLAWILIAGFLPLVALASWRLKHQLQQLAQAESAWRDEAAWRRAMQDSALVALRARDAQGRLVYVNRTYCELVGRREDELLGVTPPLPYWPPDALGEVMQRHQRNLAGQAPREGYEAQWVHRDGHRLTVMVFESPLLDAHGTQLGWMGSIVDVTERKRLEERERQRVDTQAHHARLTMLGEVASTLAHELNQPLSAIASYNAGLVNALQQLGVQDAKVLLALQRQGEQAASAGRVVQRIRAFLTRREPQREACALAPVITQATALLAKELAQGQVHLVQQLAPELPMLWADAVLLEQVVINLVRNAADALQACAHERRIHISAERSGGFVCVHVQDNGPGLGAHTVETLCAPFFTTKREGMGMGLAICRSIVELHQGVLHAATLPEGGARFSFSLPLSKPEHEH